MAQYSVLEKTIARVLESTPFLRDLIRKVYKRVIYYVYKKGYKLKLHSEITLLDIAEGYKKKNFDAFFFGYYDKNPMSLDSKYFLAHELKADEMSIVLLDQDTKNASTIDTSKAWNYQQGSMSQWCNAKEFLFNDYKEGVLGCYKYDIENSSKRFYPFPVQVVNPRYNEYLSLNYRRLALLRPDYGYFIECENFSDDMSYDKDGIWKIDIETGKAKLIVSISSLQGKCEDEYKGYNHKVNHCYYSPNGEKFVFLHRWIGKKGKFSRLYCTNKDGEDRKILLDFRMISHYSWLNSNSIIAWARTPEHGDAYVILDVNDGSYYALDKDLSLYGDGHPTVDPTGRYIITDTYPNKSRMRTLLLYDLEKKNTIEVGEFFSPWKFDNEKRCDLHPRWCNESLISIDSAHEGKRKTYLVDVKKVIDG